MFKRLGWCCVALLAIFASSVGAAEGKPLFSAERPAAAMPQRPPAARGPEIGATEPAGDEPRLARTARRRSATMDAEQLAALRLDVLKRSQSAIVLNLFADAELKAVFERTEPTAAGYTLTGRIKGQAHSTVVLAVNGDMVAGTVWTHDGIHTIEAIGGAAVIRQAGPGAFGQCADPAQAQQPADRAPSRAQGPTTHRPTAHDDDGSVIDLLVVYPSLVRRSQGGHRFMRALIDRDVALANEAYRASGAAQRLNLVAAVEVEHAAAEKDTNMYRIHDHLVNPASGYLDEVHALRDSYAADLVLLHRGDLAGTGVALGNVSGIAYQLQGLSEAEALWALSVSDSFAFSHELGHNMGLRHDRSLDVHNTPFPYSHGYIVADPPEQLEGAYTIMAYGATEKKLPRFSNPNQRYPDAEGVPLGVPGDQPSDSADGPADAVRSLNGARRVVANFRRSANRCAYSLSSPPSTVPAAGGAYRVQIGTTSNCAWAAHSNDPFVSITSSTGGTGDGSVDYAVSANPGWEREVALMIAGKVLLTKQAGARALPPPAVCERSESVRYELKEAVGKPCADITAQDLASLRKFWVHTADGGPWAGDFLGLVNLLDLRMGSHNLHTLPANVFDGMPNLFKLTLKYNHELQTIQFGAFNGLSNLHELDIIVSALTSLQPGAFHGLYNLHKLFILWSPLTSLQPGAFNGLANLHDLTISESELTSLQPGVFDGLSELSDLEIASSSLTSVAPGVFRDLPNLTWLNFPRPSMTMFPPNVFAGLENLEHLSLSPDALPPGLFNGLSKLTSLVIHDSPLTALRSDMFDGLSNLEDLYFWWFDALVTVEPSAFAGLDNLELLALNDSPLTALTASSLRGLSNLEVLDVNDNAIADISGLSTLAKLEKLYLANNLISDIAPLVANAGLGDGDYVRLDGNPLGADALAEDVPALRRRGVEVRVTGLRPTAIVLYDDSPRDERQAPSSRLRAGGCPRGGRNADSVMATEGLLRMLESLRARRRSTILDC